MVDGDLLEEPSGGGTLPGAEHVYLEADFDLLGERPLREQGLNLQIKEYSGKEYQSCKRLSIQLIVGPHQEIRKKGVF